MSGQNLKHALFGAAAAGALVIGLAGPANAAIVTLEGWNLNLSVANGQPWTTGGGTIGAGTFSNQTNIDYMIPTGSSLVHQRLLLGLPNGQTFDDSGRLQIATYFKEPDGGALNIVNLPGTDILYFRFLGLTGTFNAALVGPLANTITFDPGVGTIQLILDNQAGNTLDLANFAIVAPSGGSNVQFFGGANANAHIDITMSETSGIAGLYTGGTNGTATDGPPTLHLINVDALVDIGAPPPNPLFTQGGVNTATCTADGSVRITCDLSTLAIVNSGQYNVAAPAKVPEPGTLSLLGAGLLLLGFGSRRRKAS